MQSNCYFIVIIDDNTRKLWTYGVMFNNMFFLVFKIWKKSVKTETRLKLNSLRIDSGGEYISLALKKFCKEDEVVMEFISLYIPKQNSIAKQSWRTLDTMKNVTHVDSKHRKEFLVEVMVIAAYFKNIFPTSSKEKVLEDF